MSLELAVWRIDSDLAAVPARSLDRESRLEDFLAQDISIVAPQLLVIGRQVRTEFGGYIDLLAIDIAGNLTLIELKRDLTPREVVAQALDYGSWVAKLEAVKLTEIYLDYVKRSPQRDCAPTLEEAFTRRFGLKALPEDLNQEHSILLVASGLDESTERIVNYLAEYHEVSINAVFFRVFRDADREYLTRVWLRDPTMVEAEPPAERSTGKWNNEYYVSFGHDENRDWEEARKFGFISGGGGPWYTNTLQLLSPGDRVWVNVPGEGYVGVGRVNRARTPIEEFPVRNDDGSSVPLIQVAPKAARHVRAAAEPERAEYVVGVDWIKTVPLSSAIHERGFFGNQNTVARPKTNKWDHTIQRLKAHFGIGE